MDALLFASQVTEERKGPDAALTLLDKMVEAGNVSKGIQIARSAMLRKTGKKAEAFTEIKKLAIDETDDANILAELAKSQAEMGYLLDAIETANNALKIDPENSEMHLLIGTHQGRSGQLDLAIHHLIDAVRIDQKSIEGYLELGEMYQQRREYNLARKVYQDAIKANPKNARLHYHLALALKEAKDFAGSEAMLRKAAELDPQDLKIRRQLGAVIALNLVQNAQEVNQIS
jgi:Flp pilus assembly protein TadD